MTPRLLSLWRKDLGLLPASPCRPYMDILQWSILIPFPLPSNPPSIFPWLYEWLCHPASLGATVDSPHSLTSLAGEQSLDCSDSALLVYLTLAAVHQTCIISCLDYQLSCLPASHCQGWVFKASQLRYYIVQNPSQLPTTFRAKPVPFLCAVKTQCIFLFHDSTLRGYLFESD